MQRASTLPVIDTMLRTRVLTALVLAAVFLGALFGLPQSGWVLFTFAIMLVALWEWSQIVRFTGKAARFFLSISLLAGLALLYLFSLGRADVALQTSHYAFSIGTIAASLFWIVVVPLWLKFGWRPRNAWLLAATGWLVIFPTWLALIEHRDQSPWVLLGFVALVWVADIAAYFTGRAFGRHKLAPAISPGKTWEGVAGAMLGVLVYAAACLWLAARFGDDRMEGIVNAWPIVMLACLVLAALSIIGDLFESWMKRAAGLKDSSNLLPGHGGVLDRIDALTSTLPVAPLIFLVATRLVAP